MEDQTDQSLGGSPEETPETPAPVGSADFEKFKTELLTSIKEENDKRWQGWQKTLAQRDRKQSEFEQTLNELKTSTLSESEREQLMARAESQELASLRAEREVWRLSQDYPEEAPLYQRILEAPSAKDQLEILREFRSNLTASPQSQTPQQGQEQPIEQPQSNSPIDPNNPPAPIGVGTFEKRFEQDPSVADKLLRTLRWRDTDS